MSGKGQGRNGITYADAGVDIDAGNALVDRIKPAAKRTNRPGVMAGQILEESAEAMEEWFEANPFANPRYEQAAREMVEKASGVFSHPVGMAVHDDGDYNYRRLPLAPGMVFSVDPTIRVPEENLYLRYEDTVVVTEDGVENFTDFLASELDDLEALTREDGVVQKVPAISDWPE